MRKIMILIVLVAAFASCKNETDGDATATMDAQEVTTASGDAYVIGNESTVGWYGETPTHGHSGTFNISDGTIYLEDNNITGGNLTIDLATMKITDKDTNGATKLMGHLMSADFFEAEKYGTASFVITGSEVVEGDENITHTISGNLTLKDSTKNVVIPTKVTLEDKSLTAMGEVKINRTDWGMHYGNDESLKDKFIRPNVNISLNIQANK